MLYVRAVSSSPVYRQKPLNRAFVIMVVELMGVEPMQVECQALLPNPATPYHHISILGNHS